MMPRRESGRPNFEKSQPAVTMSSIAYTPKPLHFLIPHGIFLHEATAVAVDSDDNVFVFNRGNVPVLVFSPDGHLNSFWGNPTPFEGTDPSVDTYGNPRMRWRGTEFVRPHAVTIDSQDHVWLVDDMANTITKCKRDGTRLMVLRPNGEVLTKQEDMEEIVGQVAEPPPIQSGAPFNRPTDVCVDSSNGDIFVSDGYGNSRGMCCVLTTCVCVTRHHTCLFFLLLLRTSIILYYCFSPKVENTMFFFLFFFLFFSHSTLIFYLFFIYFYM